MIINIPTPNAVHQYNSGIGDTNCMDQNIVAFRVSIREKNGGGQHLHGLASSTNAKRNNFSKNL